MYIDTSMYVHTLKCNPIVMCSLKLFLFSFCYHFVPILIQSFIVCFFTHFFLPFMVVVVVVVVVFYLFVGCCFCCCCCCFICAFKVIIFFTSFLVVMFCSFRLYCFSFLGKSVGRMGGVV